jgi:cytochrome c-type biogenesis protein CcmH/NrfG
MIRWGYDLMQENHLPEAIDVLKLDVQLFPSSANGYDSLGEAYMKGEKQLAIDSYKKSLELNPANDNAKEKLKMLETATAAK